MILGILFGSNRSVDNKMVCLGKSQMKGDKLMNVWAQGTCLQMNCKLNLVKLKHSHNGHSASKDMEYNKVWWTPMMMMMRGTWDHGWGITAAAWWQERWPSSSDEWREAGEGRPWPGLVVHDQLGAVETDHGTVAVLVAALREAGVASCSTRQGRGGSLWCCCCMGFCCFHDFLKVLLTLA